jgi:amino-acid N-acetyltransferase
MDKRKNRSRAESKAIQRPITYSFATPADKNRIRRFLSECGLPTRYISRHLKSFLLAKAAKKMVGVVGLEIYGRVGLLRSMCVDPAYRGQGIARMLTAMIMAHARMRKIVRLYLFTVSAEKFASKLGFHRLDRKRIPKSVRSTWQFKAFKPYPVICMMKPISH